METKISLMDEIKQGGYETSLITTFNAYLPFYEDVVLRKLMSNGVRHNVLLMDSKQCQQSFNSHPPSNAGRRYTLLPMKTAGAFHPKIILLLGKKKGLLSIGSHNLTLSGFGVNRELTNVVRFKGDENDGSVGIFYQVWRYIESWVEAQQDLFLSHFIEMVRKVKGFAPWLTEDALSTENVSVIATSNNHQSLWSQLKEVVHEPIERVYVGGAFFDSELAFLHLLVREFVQAEIIVGVDPNSVKAPPSLANLEGAHVVNTSALKPENDKEGQYSGYLHAKSLVLETFEGKVYLVTGSANPSAPAWLASATSANTEMMIIRADNAAVQTAAALGLTKIKDAPSLKEDEWICVENNWKRDNARNESNIPLGIAVAKNDRIELRLHNEIDIPFGCLLQDENYQSLENIQFSALNRSCELKPTPHNVPLITNIEIWSEENCVERFFVHHESQILEQSRTGTQRKFREALSSISFDSPDLETFLSCAERIIFEKSDDINSSKKQLNKENKKASGSLESEVDTKSFMVDISDTKKAKKKYRLQAKEDLAYLLDILIYHLKIDDGELQNFESVDQQGRSEEEQVGADDEPIKSLAEKMSENTKIIALCHKKVKTLVNRMVENLKKYRKGGIDIESLIVKLTGVLAVLRELRNCDGKQSWVAKGQTTVPTASCILLLRAILESLFEGEKSFWQIEQTYPDIADAEDILNLKGLLLWLTWNCGFSFNPNKAFAETPKEEETRLQQNASVLAIAQLIDDEEVIEHATKNIGPSCGGDLGWINWIAQFAFQITKIKAEASIFNESNIVPGDIAIHKTIPNMVARVVKTIPDGDKVGMICFDSEKPLKLFSARTIKCIAANDVIAVSY